ncbi:MAG: DUF2344 domain-containing protein [Actinobacteria bacterium]|nr:DUF2344 domain-containing protein [Actinomycetota bacterium]
MKGDRGFPVRLRFTKRGRVRFISHRDVARALERAFRVEGLPLAFTEGFAPRPKVSFGLALPTGYESDAEYLDAGLTEEVDLDDLITGVSASLPEGMGVADAVFLEPRAASLQRAVTSVSYVVQAVWSGDDARDPSDVEAWIQNTLRADALPVVVQRKGTEVIEDLRPAILHLSIGSTGVPDETPEGPVREGPIPERHVTEGVTLQLEVSTQPKSIRPTEVLGTLDAGPERPFRAGNGLRVATIVRTAQWIERDGSRLCPLEADTRQRAEVGAR